MVQKITTPKKQVISIFISVSQKSPSSLNTVVLLFSNLPKINSQSGAGRVNVAYKKRAFSTQKLIFIKTFLRMFFPSCSVLASAQRRREFA